MDEGYVKSWNIAGVSYIEFFHPQSNSLPAEILEQTAKSIREAGQNTEARCIVLQSGGQKAFCAGASFDELIAIQSQSEGLRFFSGFANVINAIRTVPKFVIGRAQGKAVGGGLGLASAVDYCFATSASSIKLSELAVGIGPFVVGPAVERKMGKSAFCQLSMDASEWQPAEWAAQRGLYMNVAPSIEEMDQELNLFVQRMVAYNPDAMAEIKRMLWTGTETWDQLLLERAAISGRLVLSDFTRNSIQNFKSK